MILGVTYMDVTKQKTTSKQDSCLLKDLREPGPSPTAWIKCFLDIDYTEIFTARCDCHY
jgi:hypothetical protein